MSAYSDWKAGYISDSDYAFLCKQEWDDDLGDEEGFDDEEAFEEDEIEDF